MGLKDSIPEGPIQGWYSIYLASGIAQAAGHQKQHWSGHWLKDFEPPWSAMYSVWFLDCEKSQDKEKEKDQVLR